MRCRLVVSFVAAAACALAAAGGALPGEPIDAQPPTVQALPSSGKRGTVIKLRYRAVDDSGKAAKRVEVYRGSELVAQGTVDLSESKPGEVYYTTWRPPPSIFGRFRFCVTAIDEAGNESRPSCAPLRVR